MKILHTRCARIAARALATTLGAAASAASAFAFEAGHSPDTLPGATIGSAVGATPPSGWYFANNFSYEALSFYDNAGHKLPANLAAWIDLPVVLWVPDVHVLGGQFSAALVQPIVQATPTVFGKTNTQTGLFNTAITPANLSWALPNHLFASAGVTLYPPDGTASKGAAVDIGNNWWTVSPDVAVSYLNDGWTLSLKGTYDINSLSADRDTGVTSGDVLIADYSGTKQFGKWRAGIGGFFVQQVSADTPSTSPFAGKRLQRVALGPVGGYDVGPVDFNAYFTQDVVTRNTLGGSEFWFTFALRL